MLTSETIAERLAKLTTIAETLADITQAFAIEREEASHSDLLFWVEAARKSIASHHRDLTSSVPAEIRSRLAAIGEIARKMALSMEFGFLLNTERMLLSIGFVVPQGALDESCYDLLASEAQACELRGDRQGRSSSPALVSPRSRCYSGGRRYSAYLLVGLDVRVSDALAGHARADR